jgi:peptide deformylase
MRVNAELKELVGQMFEIMYEFRGVGLAANQVNLPIRLFVANPSGEREEGPELVFINPVIVKSNGSVVSEEGCLSLPGLNAPVKRSKTLQVNAFALDGTEINANIDGFLSRIIQHEIDHLDGVLFIDRLSEEVRRPLDPDIAKFETAYARNSEMGRIPAETELQSQIADWEAKFC